MTCLVDTQTSATILVVDDDAPDNLQLVFQHLRNAGHKILIAHSGQRAVNIAQVVQPDLILLDIKMSLVPRLAKEERPCGRSVRQETRSDKGLANALKDTPSDNRIPQSNFDAFSTCRYLKSKQVTKNIPIIFMSEVVETRNKVRGFMLGAVDYITKPIAEQELVARIQTHLGLHHLNQRLAKDAARQKLLFKISDRIRRSLDLDLIMETATKEIRSFLDCDFVGLAQIEGQQIEMKAAFYAEDNHPRLNVTYEDLCGNGEELQFYLQGNIKNFIEDSKFDSSNSLPKLENRLIAPILIKHEESIDNYAQINSTEPDKLFLWGWLIADRYHLAPCWQGEDLKLLKELTTQLAIAIRQGLLHDRISKLAILDPLTKVYNRRYFDRQLNLEWRRLRRSASPISLIMCDIDHFKIYNDTYGHQQGDKCLQQIAQGISKVVKRSGDVLARYGGEEFIVILPLIDTSGAIQVAKSIELAIKKLAIPHRNSPTAAVVTASIGVASTIPNSENQPHLLVEAADRALYQAKALGRDCIAVDSQLLPQSTRESA